MQSLTCSHLSRQILGLHLHPRSSDPLGAQGIQKAVAARQTPMHMAASYWRCAPDSSWSAELHQWGCTNLRDRCHASWHLACSVQTCLQIPQIPVFWECLGRPLMNCMLGNMLTRSATGLVTNSRPISCWRMHGAPTMPKVPCICNHTRSKVAATKGNTCKSLHDFNRLL